MSYQGDLAEDQILYFTFPTRTSAYTAITLAGTPSLEVYKDADTTQTTAGLTLGVDHDGITGFHLVTVDTSADAFYVTGADYTVKLAAGTVDGVDVTHETIGTFSIRNRATEVAINNIGGIASTGGAALPVEVTSDNAGGAIIGGITKVGTETGTYTNTEADDTVYHVITHAANAIDWVYGISVGAGFVAASFNFKGYLTSANDSINVQAWNGSGWDTRSVLTGQGGTTDVSLSSGLLAKHTNSNMVYLRFVCTGQTAPVLNVNLLEVLKVNTSRSAGYANGALWYDDSVGNTNTEAFTDGTADNPVSSEAAIQTLLTSTGLSVINIAPGSTYTMAASHDGLLLFAHGSTIALGGQSINNTHIFHAAVSGVGTSSNEVEFHDCEIGTASLQKAHCYDCTFDGTVTWTLAGDYHLINCQSGVPGSSSPTFTKTAGQAVTAEFRRWSGGITFSGLEATDTLTISGELGTIDLGSPAGAVAIEIRGSYKAVTNVGSASVNYDGAWRGADVANTMKKNTTLSNFMFLMTDSGTHKPKTGLTVTPTRSLDGAAFGACANSVTEVSGGWYKIDLAAADTNGDTVALRFTATDADDTNLGIVTQP